MNETMKPSCGEAYDATSVAVLAASETLTITIGMLTKSPLAAIAEKLRAVVSRLGVETYGTAGEAFDPQQHEAIFHAPNPGGVADGTILDVVEVGYRLGDIELRPAKVVVAGSAE